MKTGKKTDKRTLKDIYEETGETNALKLAELSKKSVAYVKQFLKKQNETFDVATNTRQKTGGDVSSGSPVHNHWQADVMYLNDFKNLKDNKQNIGILTLLNTNTRQARARGIKSTQAKDINKAMTEMIISIDFDISILRTDGGAEFTNKAFKQMMSEFGVILEYAEPHTHGWLSRTDRFHRTLKELLRDRFIANGNKNIWLPYLPEIIEDYNNTPSQAFRNIDALKEPAKSANGKPYYSPVAPNVIANSGPKILAKINEHELKQAKKVAKIDGEMFKVGDYVRLQANGKENNKFLKNSINNKWTTQIYQIIERTGPNFWRVNDSTQWTTKMLKKSNKRAFETQNESVEAKELSTQKARVARAKKQESLNIAKKPLMKQTRTRAKIGTRNNPRIDYAKLTLA